MLITSDEKIFNPVYNPEFTNKLRGYRDTLVNKMTPIKLEWVRNVLNYNQLSKEAFAYRFTKKNIKGVQQVGQGCDKTDEELYGQPYFVSEIGKKKVDQFNQDFCARDYTCKVQSTAYPKQVPIIQSLLNNVLDRSNFQVSLQSAFFDATIKKVGYLRSRIYKSTKTTYLKDSNGNYKDLIKQGIQVEYVNVEDVVVDISNPTPNDCFICTPYSASELNGLIPQLKPYLEEMYLGMAQTHERDTEIKPIIKERLKYYKLGEALVQVYNSPDLIKNIPVTDEIEKEIRDAIGKNYGFGQSTFDSISNSIVILNGSNDNINTYNPMYSYLNNHKYLLNEYFNWETGQYVVFIGDYVLYSGAMFGDIIDCPLGKIYFQHKQQQGWFGTAVNDNVWRNLTELDIMINKNRASIEEARLKIIQIDNDLLETDGSSMKVEGGFNYLSVKSTNASGDPRTTNPIQQIPISDPLLASYGAMEQSLLAKIESIYPDTANLNAQLPKEAVQDMIYSRDRLTNSILKTNIHQLSFFAYNLFVSIISSMTLLSVGEIVVYTAGNSKVGLVIRDKQADLEMAKQQVGVSLRNDYMTKLDGLKEQVRLSDKYKEVAKQTIDKTISDINNENMKVMADNNIIPTEEETAKLNEIAGAKVQDNLNELETQMAQQLAEKQGLVPQEDNNWYFTHSILSNMVNVYQDWKFDFSKSKMEQQQSLVQFLSSISQLPLAGHQIDYKTFMEDLCILNGFNPETISREIQTASQIQGSINTRFQYYNDFVKDPIGFIKYQAKVLGVPENELTDVMNQAIAYHSVLATSGNQLAITKEIASVDPAQAFRQSQEAINSSQQSYQSPFQPQNPQ